MATALGVLGHAAVYLMFAGAVLVAFLQEDEIE